MTLYDSRGEPITIRTQAHLVCDYCGFDNTPGPLADGAPRDCEGCGATL